MYKNMTVTRGTRNRVVFVLTAHGGIVSVLYSVMILKKKLININFRWKTKFKTIRVNLGA